MPLRQLDDDTDLFEIVLPSGATAEQEALKSKIDQLLQTLKDRKSDPETAPSIKHLRDIADTAFATAEADTATAASEVDTIVKAVTRPKPDNPPPPPPERPGAFEVALPDPGKVEDQGISWRELIFNVTGELHPVPPSQLKLKADVETILTTLHTIFPDDDRVEKPKNPSLTQRRFGAYQIKLLGIAQTGLQTPSDPESAQQALEGLQSEILVREGPQVKNGYMKRLGAAAAVSAAAAAAVYLVLRNNPQLSQLLYEFRNLFVLWTGTMIGTWLSFGLRRPKVSFKDLGAIEDDMVEPAIRLVFTGLIALTIAFIFICKMVNVNVGGLSSADLFAHGSSALLIGMLLGVSEQALPGALTRRGSQFVSEIGGKT